MRSLLERVDPRVRKARLGDCPDLYTYLLELQQLTAATLATEARAGAASSSSRLRPVPAVCTTLLEELDAMGWEALVHLHPTLTSLRLRSAYDPPHLPFFVERVAGNSRLLTLTHKPTAELSVPH
jgi:hypothetical protein